MQIREERRALSVENKYTKWSNKNGINPKDTGNLEQIRLKNQEPL